LGDNQIRGYWTKQTFEKTRIERSDDDDDDDASHLLEILAFLVSSYHPTIIDLFHSM
jgi:hypothetical protein